MQVINLKNRIVFSVEGQDREKFLQQMITNDINKLQTILYAAILNNKGRFMADVFLYKIGDDLLMDLYEETAEMVVKKFEFYRLRANVEFINGDKKVFAVFGDGDYCDPRSSALWQRVISNDLVANQDFEYYEKIRIKNGVIDPSVDMEVEKSILARFNFDKLNGVDYKKGCYMGQELVSKGHYVAERKFDTFAVEFLLDLNIVIKNAIITYKNAEIGKVLSYFTEGDRIFAIIVLELVENFVASDLKLSYDHNCGMFKLN